MTNPLLDPASFRDRESRVFHHHGQICRALSARALEDWRALASSGFFPRAIANGQIVATKESDISPEELATLAPHWTTALEHQRLPFLSYPYEWTFSMLQDAASLHIKLLLQALEENLIIKDSSAYNIQWVGASPTFIDIPSFKRLEPGEPWVGYLQFCQLFLYPLMLTAYKDLPFHPWLRGAIDGVTPQEASQIMSLRDRLRAGVLTHVYLQAKLQEKTQRSTSSVKEELVRSGFSRQMIVANVRRLGKLVARLNWGRSNSEWSDYASDNSYSEVDHQQKADFVRHVVEQQRRELVWDLGCNTGVFSRIAAENTDYVVAMDADHLAVDRLYRQLKGDGLKNILPLVNNLADPSPDLGWRGRERLAMTSRPLPQLTLCLALIHHLVISANIPVDDLIDWLASLRSDLIIEFVTKQDPMVQQLLLNKEDIYDDYELEYFERVLTERFEVERRQRLDSGTRVLFHAAARA